MASPALWFLGGRIPPVVYAYDDGPGDVREMTKWSLLVLDMYLMTDLHANNVRFMTKQQTFSINNTDTHFKVKHS